MCLLPCKNSGKDSGAALAMHCHMHQCVDILLVVAGGEVDGEWGIKHQSG